MLKVQLTRDLRKNILRGHPWVYREAIEPLKKVDQACLCEVLDKKRKPLGWGLYSPEGPLALRLLSLEKKPPGQKFFSDRMQQALNLRLPLRSPQTTAFRLFNGEGDGLPGLICDVYGELAVIQFDGSACFEFWDQDFVAQWLLENASVKSVYCKPRRSDDREGRFWGQSQKPVIEVLENGHKFLVNFIEGQKTGFFLDQRENRQYLKTLAQGKRVLNLFSYTGGFSIYAGAGGAEQVTSVDLSEPALDLAEKSWTANGFKEGAHQTLAVDVFDFMEKELGQYDIVMVDPPSMTHSEKTKNTAVNTYTDLFAKSSKLVKSGGHLVLSSCSSHISFEDFFSIIDEALSQGRRNGQILRVSGQGSDHPFPHYCRELRYLKFVDLILN